MATYNLRRFSHPDTLKHIAPTHLLALLSPHAEYFRGKGVDVATGSDGLDYQGLAHVLMEPEADMPHDLVEALYFIHEMATAEAMDILLTEAPLRDIAIADTPDQTPADVALQVWLQDRDLLERKHAEQQTLRHRSFEYYQTETRPLPRFRGPAAGTLKALEGSLNDWFEAKRRGRGARVFAYSREDGVWFLVRHGEAFKREGSIDHGQSSSVFYRPEKHDVLVYDPKLGELRMHACSKGEREIYRAEFGRHLFGDERFFPGTAKYTLDPLRTQGLDSLTCVDIEGMDEAILMHCRAISCDEALKRLKRFRGSLRQALGNGMRETRT